MNNIGKAAVVACRLDLKYHPLLGGIKDFLHVLCRGGIPAKKAKVFIRATRYGMQLSNLIERTLVMVMTIRPLFCAILVIVGLLGTASAEKVNGEKTGSTATQLSKAKTDVVHAADQYKASVKALIPHYEEAVKSATEAVEKRKELFEKGLVSKRDIEDAEKALKDAQAQVDQARHQLVETDQLIAEATAEPKSTGPSSTGRYASKSAVMRYSGASGWAIAEASKVEGFFSSKFGRQLPISAFGQSETHNRLGFDHRNSVDVALHPDSAEGKALMEYLQTNGIPFLAFRSAIPGVATGAHIHIGYPSHRI